MIDLIPFDRAVHCENFYLDGLWIYGEDEPLSSSQSDWEHWL